jgi:hypothetical protein
MKRDKQRERDMFRRTDRAKRTKGRGSFPETNEGSTSVIECQKSCKTKPLKTK